MKKQENQKPEKEILKDLQEVHENIKNDKEKKYDPNELSHKTKELDKQMEGSDADRDRSVEGEEVGKVNVPQVKGSDASQA